MKINFVTTPTTVRMTYHFLRASFVCFLLLFSNGLYAQQKPDTTFFPQTKRVKSITEYFPKFNRVSQFTEAGRPEKTEEMQEGKRNGMCLYYNYQGKIIEKTKFVSGKKNGLSTRYYENGNTEFESHYKNDTLHGLHQEYYESSIIRKKEKYENGYKKGLSESFYLSGKKASKGMYDTLSISKKNNRQNNKIQSVKHGLEMQWYGSGQVKTSCTYEKGEKNGVCSEWYENGKLKSKGRYRLDEINGEQAEYFNDGKLSFKYFATVRYDSVRKTKITEYEGEYLRYSESGEPLNVRGYKDGLPHGKWKDYYQGKLSYISSYKKGLKVDSSIGYNKYGQPTNIEFYKIFRINGKDSSCLDGIIQDFGYNNFAVREKKYSNGKCIAYSNNYSNGKVESETFVDKNMVNRNDYYETGTIRRSFYPKEYEPDKDLEKHNLESARDFFENGEVHQDKQKRDGKLVISKEFNKQGQLTGLKYALTDIISIQTKYYPTGKIKLESIYWGSHKTSGLQYVEWYENGNPKSIEIHGVLDIEWLSDGTYYKSSTFRNFNPLSDRLDTILPLPYVRKMYEVLKSSTRKNLSWEAKEGEITTEYGQGKPKIETFLRNGYVDNFLRFYYFSGKPMVSFELKNGLLNGDFFLFSQSGKIVEKGRYLNGKACGQWLKATQNGDTLEFYELAEPVDNQDNAQYTFRKEFYSDSYLHLKKPVLKEYTYRIGDSIKVFYSYHSNGNPFTVSRSKYGKAIGPYRLYWNNGKLGNSYDMDDLGRKQGRYLSTFFETDQIENERIYRNDTLEGIATGYWPNGKQKTTGIYRKNLKEGQWLSYDSLGKLLQKDYFEKGQKTLAKAPPGCHCNTSVLASTSGMLPLSELVDFERADFYQFAFHLSVTQQLKKTFFKNHNVSFDRDENSTTRLQLVSFSEIKTHLPGKNGFEFVLNPCVLFQNESHINLTAFITKTNPSENKIIIRPQKLALRFKTQIVKPLDVDLQRTEAYFDAKELFYEKKGITLTNIKVDCFTKSVIINTKATLILDTWWPVLGKSDDEVIYPTEELLKTIKFHDRRDFYGLTKGAGTIGSVDDPDLHLDVERVTLSDHFASGEIVLKSVTDPAIGSTFLVGSKSLTETQAVKLVKDLLLKRATIIHKLDKEKLIISFIIKP